MIRRAHVFIHTSSYSVTSIYDYSVFRGGPFGFYAQCGYFYWRNSPIGSSVSRWRAWDSWPEPRGWFLLSLLYLICHLWTRNKLWIWWFWCLIREKSFLLYPFGGDCCFCGSSFGSSDSVLHSLCWMSHSPYFRLIPICWEWGYSRGVPSYCCESSNVISEDLPCLLPICDAKFT